MNPQKQMSTCQRTSEQRAHSPLIQSQKGKQNSIEAGDKQRKVTMQNQRSENRPRKVAIRDRVDTEKCLGPRGRAKRHTDFRPPGIFPLSARKSRSPRSHLRRRGERKSPAGPHARPIKDARPTRRLSPSRGYVTPERVRSRRIRATLNALLTCLEERN